VYEEGEMEGYLLYNKKERVYVVLDGQQLMVYNRLDVAAQQCCDIKSTLNLKDGRCEKLAVVNRLDLDSRGNSSMMAFYGIKFSAQGARAQSISFECESADLCARWFSAGNRAVELHKEDELRLVLPGLCRKQLGLDEKATLSKSLITRAYKKLCLKAHPDRGGDAEEFNKINKAYNSLLELQAADEEEQGAQVIDFEAVIEKAPHPVGLGILVSEDKLRKRIIITKIDEGIKIHGLSDEAEGEIRAGDAIIAIDKDDCHTWLLTRLSARLSALRVPVGSTVTFIFERRVLPKTEEEQSESQANSPQNSPVSSSRKNYAAAAGGGSDGEDSRSNNATSTFADIDEEIYTPPPTKESAHEAPSAPEGGGRGGGGGGGESDSLPASPSSSSSSSMRPPPPPLASSSSNAREQEGEKPLVEEALVLANAGLREAQAEIRRLSEWARQLEARNTEQAEELAKTQSNLREATILETNAQAEARDLRERVGMLTHIMEQQHFDDESSAMQTKLLLETQDMLMTTAREKRTLASHICALRYSLQMEAIPAIDVISGDNGTTNTFKTQAETYRLVEERARLVEEELTILTFKLQGNSSSNEQ